MVCVHMHDVKPNISACLKYFSLHREHLKFPINVNDETGTSYLHSLELEEETIINYNRFFLYI